MDVEPGRHAKSNGRFSLKEYECLRDEIIWLLKDYRALERNAVIAVAVSWGWLLKYPETPKFAWLLPVLFVSLGALRASGIFKQFGVFHLYVETIESAFRQKGDPDGWERYSWKKTGWVSSSAIAFWVILWISTIGIGIYEFLSCLHKTASTT